MARQSAPSRTGAGIGTSKSPGGGAGSRYSTFVTTDGGGLSLQEPTKIVKFARTRLAVRRHGLIIEPPG